MARNEKINASLPMLVSPLSSVQNNPGCRRRRFHGWISDDNNKEDFVFLPPAHWVGQLAELINNMVEKRRKMRKRRWDVKPGDLSD